MEVKEIRFGNLVNHKGTMVKLGIMELAKIFNYGTEKEYEPIKLTGELLLKFGFTYDYVFCDVILIMQENKMLGYDLKNGGLFLAYHKEKDFRDIRIATINYIHQLQNLYFVLTGEELSQKND